MGFGSWKRREENVLYSIVAVLMIVALAGRQDGKVIFIKQAFHPSFFSLSVAGETFGR